MTEDESARPGGGPVDPDGNRDAGDPIADATTLGGSPAPRHGEPGRESGPPAEGVGQRVGPYRLLQLLGEGGFGSVFLAEQTEPVKRRVALKVIKQGMDTRQVIARFEQERQALAMMDHPSIAKVLEAGATETGRPYFVMELVKGEPITAYCDKQNLPIAARLELFAQICSAVQHAHAKGIIHRDLKPSNVLVSVEDGQPQAKVIDFGIAKAAAGNLTEKTLFTEHRQMIGTPEYMSPEQAEGSLDIDTRTDIYALGVLLYELLTGSTPFDPRRLRSAAFVEVLRIIREVDPPSPSTRLSQSVATLSTVAAHRRTEPKKLGSILRGELDWIVMKALEKDRQRRYETANGLAMDIRRYLAGEAVTAAPPSRVYRMRKFVRRHRVAVSAASLVAAALLVAVAGIAWQASVARAQRDKAERIADFMAEMLRGVGPSVARGRDTTMLHEMMSAAAARIEKGELASAPEAELRLRSTIGATFTELALYEEAEKMLAPAVPLARSLRAGDREATAEALTNLANLLDDRGDLEAAEPLYREALAMDRRLFPGDDARVATDLNNLAQLLEDRGDLAAAEPLARQALEMRRRLFPGDHIDVAESLNNLANLIGGPRGRGDTAAALPLFREALAMNRRLFPGDHPRVAGSLNNLAVVLRNSGDLAGAEPLARETLEMRRRLFPGDHPYVATALNNLALLLQDRGDLVTPEALFRESLAMRRRLFPAGNSSVATDLYNLARLLQQRGDLEQAEPLLREAAELYERTQGKAYWPTGNARMSLGRLLVERRRFTQAEPELLAAEESFAAAQGVPAERREQCFTALANLYESWDRAEPGRGHGARAAKWKAELESLAAAKAAKVKS
jgi:serine/threonine protein kinase